MRRPFLIDCGACIKGLGAVLGQQTELVHERRIAFASYVLPPHERKWHTTELEAFAIVRALETFPVYVEGSPTLVRTARSPLLWLRSQRTTTGKLARWAMRLQDLSFDVQHRPGNR